MGKKLPIYSSKTDLPPHMLVSGFPGGSESTCQGRTGADPWVEASREGMAVLPLQYSCLKIQGTEERTGYRPQDHKELNSNRATFISHAYFFWS